MKLKRLDNERSGKPTMSLSDTVDLFKTTMRGNPQSDRTRAYMAESGFQGGTATGKTQPQLKGCFICYNDKQRANPKHRKHGMPRCFVLHEGSRPEGFKPRQEALDALSKAMQDPAIRTDLENIKKKVKERDAKKHDKANNVEEPLSSLVFLHVSNALDASKELLRDSVIVSTGSPWPICNNRNRLITLDPIDPAMQSIRASGGSCNVEGIGVMRVKPTKPWGKGMEEMTFSRALFIPSWPVNVISVHAITKKNVFFDSKHQNLFFRNPKSGNKIPMAHVEWKFGQYVLEYKEPETQAAYTTQPAAPSSPPPAAAETVATIPSQYVMKFPIFHPSQQLAF
jgi:hypothetical protein